MRRTTRGRSRRPRHRERASRMARPPVASPGPATAHRRTRRRSRLGPHVRFSRVVGHSAAPAAELYRYCDTRSQVVLLDVARRPWFSHEVVPSVSALRGRHWQRWGLKHAAGVEKPSRTVDRLRGMTGKGNVSEASALRIVTSAELKRLSGSRAKMARGAGLGDFNGRPTHVESRMVENLGGLYLIEIAQVGCILDRTISSCLQPEERPCSFPS
jgi:hypothetical protein